MSELRQDPLTGRWTIIGSERAGRPNEFVEEAVRLSAGSCPFCAGNEHETPDPVAAYPKKGPWQVRVVPNKYPAVALVNGSNGSPSPKLPSHVKQPGWGMHEVIIESPRHVVSISDLTDEEAALVFRAYRDRLAALRNVDGLRYVQIFKNVGPAAGASMEHAHSQLIALNQIPEAIEQEIRCFNDAHEQHGLPLLEKIVQDELTVGHRIVAETERYVAFCPWASRFAYEVCLAPRKRQASFESVKDAELGEIAGIVRDVIGRIERALGVPAYNFFLHTQPFDSTRCDHYHWHIEIFPRVTKTAGFEWSTGCFINPVPPEAAAETLRSAASA
jgi:UDPglucose--hexose-1-phosphate uridylyltransferase